MSSSSSVQVVWFKRDLRISDHLPLRMAAQAGPVVCLYVYEPSLLGADDFDSLHLHFINDSLEELRRSLETVGGSICLRVGEVVDILQMFHQDFTIGGLWAHEETGNGLTFERDKRVRAWAERSGVDFTEIPQNGVVRALQDRDGWATQWERKMSEPLVSAPSRIEGYDPGGESILSPETFGLTPDRRPEALRGGESEAVRLLRSFLKKRGQRYFTELSSPVTAFESCSRLSPYLAYGNISLKTVVQATKRQKQQTRGEWSKSLNAFLGRLHWHCHFIQKLESEPELEFENINRAYDGLREDEFNEEFFEAWKAGQTGYPMVDACMRALHRGGWINFRMRAMLVSFCCHHLWLHWKRPAAYLATQFIDYEPGIHYPQFQMQAATTGINALRIYSPAKQVDDLDPQGLFVRRYLPELERVPARYLSEPHSMPLEVQEGCGCLIGRDYPLPIVDHKTAYNQARKRLQAHRKLPAVKAASAEVMKRHGSRRGSNSRGRKAKSRGTNSAP